MADIFGADLEMDLGDAAVVLQGVDVVIDDALSSTSKNPVQNRVVKAALDGKQNTLTAGQNVTITGDTISAEVDSAEIASNVTSWLSQNVNPVGSAVVVDSSLSIAGAAADAKATGEARNALVYSVNGGSQEIVWEQGGLANGVDTPNSARIRTGFIFVPEGTFIQVFPTTAHEAIVIFYDENKNYVSEATWSPYSYYMISNDNQYIRIVQRKLNGSDISPLESDIDLYIISNLKREFETNRADSNVISGDSCEWVNGYLEAGKQTYIATRICNKHPIFVRKGSMVDIRVSSNQMCHYNLIDIETMTSFQNAGAWNHGDLTISIPKDCILNVVFAFRNSTAINPADRNSTFIITPPAASDLINGAVEKVTRLEQGSFDPDGVTKSAAIPIRVRTKNPVFVSEGSTIEILLNGNFMVYWYLLDENMVKYASASAWTYENVILEVNKDSYLNAAFAMPGGQANISPSDFLSKAEVNIYNPLQSSVRYAAKAGHYGYTGERILLGKHSFDTEEFITLSREPSVCNGSAIWGNYIVVADTNGTSFSVYQKDGTYISSVDISSMVTSGFHGNTLLFARELHAGNEQFPYLYANAFYGDQKIYVFDVRLTGGTLSVSVVQTIDISGLSSSITGAGFADFAIDFDRNELLLIRYVLSNTFQDVAGNYTKISTFDLPSPAVGNVALSDSGVNNTNTLYDLIYARQDCVFHNGKLFMLAGSTYKSWLFAISDGQIVSRVYISDVLQQKEPEGLMITEDGLLILPRATTAIYRLLFR